MIVVKIELHSAITRRVTELGRMVICNDGTGSAKRGNYDAYVLRKHFTEGQWLARPERVTGRQGRVEEYPRLSYTVWRLVLRALRSCYPEEK
jgi:hypothetical protein